MSWERVNNKEFILREYYKDGQLEVECPMRFISPVFEDEPPKTVRRYKHGTVRFYHQNGVLKSERVCDMDSIEGEYNHYFDDGKLQITTMYKDGLRNGLHQSYYRNGQLEVECTYLNDKKHGTFKRWDEEGALIYQTEFYSGKDTGK